MRRAPGLAAGGREVLKKIRAQSAKLAPELEQLAGEAPSVASACAWGPEHGPVVLVNRRGTHAKGPNGRRATLAHELCHLLVDRGDALPLAEVKGGRVPREAEARANAFAAELLLPSAVAGAALEAVSTDPENAVERLRRKYGASQAIVAWQALNSDAVEHLHPRIEAYLRQVARRYVNAVSA